VTRDRPRGDAWVTHRSAPRGRGTRTPCLRGRRSGIKIDAGNARCRGNSRQSGGANYTRTGDANCHG
jgi:hypothetical protein